MSIVKSLELIFSGIEHIKADAFICSSSRGTVNDIKELLSEVFVASEKDFYFLIDRLYCLLEKIKHEPLEAYPLSKAYLDAYYDWAKTLHNFDCETRYKEAESLYGEFCVSEAKRAIASFLLLITDFTEKKLLAVSLSDAMKSKLNSVSDLLSSSFTPSQISDLLLYCKAFVSNEEKNKSRDSNQVNFFEELNKLFNAMCLNEKGAPRFSSVNHPQFEKLGKLVIEFSKFSDRQTAFENGIKEFFELLEQCANHSAWSKTTRKLGVPDAIKSHKRCLKARHTHAFVLQELHQKTFERWRLFPTSRHPITDYYYEQYYQLTRQLSSFFVADGQNLEFKRWLTKEDLNQVKKIIEQMGDLQNKTIHDLDQLAVDSRFVPDVTIEPKHDDQVVFTYNVQQLPMSYYPKERASYLVNYLLEKTAEERGVDVFILEEVFLPCALETLKKSRLAKDYHIIKPEGCDLLNSGVCILLKKNEFKDLKITKSPFSFATSVDQLIPKGFTHIEVVGENARKSHIVGTHTQAQYTGSNYQIIATFIQLAELAEYLSKIPSNERIILAGDLNILRASTSTIDPELLEYLNYPLSVHPTKGNSYDPQQNLLAKKLDPNGATGVLDYGLSQGYEISEGGVLTDTQYKHGTEEREISDHYPVKFTLKAKNSEPDSPLTIEEKQRLILAKLLRVAFQEASETNLLGQWKTGRAKEVYFSACKLVKHYKSLDLEQAEALGTGSDLLNYCLNYNDPTEFTSFLKKTDQDKDNPLSKFIDYRLLKGPYADLTFEVLRQDDTFEKVKKVLEEIKGSVESVEWDKKGKNLFFSRSNCPDGIKRIRLYLKNIESLDETEILKSIFTIRDLLFDKLANSDELKARWFRDKETQSTYDKFLTQLENLIKLFPSTQGITDKSENSVVNENSTANFQLN